MYMARQCTIINGGPIQQYIQHSVISPKQSQSSNHVPPVDLDNRTFLYRLCVCFRKRPLDPFLIHHSEVITSKSRIFYPNQSGYQQFVSSVYATNEKYCLCFEITRNISQNKLAIQSTIVIILGYKLTKHLTEDQ